MEQPNGQNQFTITESFLHRERREISKCIQVLHNALQERPDKGGRELALAHTKLQEAKMWLGMALGAIGVALPDGYPVDNAE